MKYNIGNMVLVKDIHPRPRPHARRRSLAADTRRRPRLQNTFGVITMTEKHSEIFEKDSTEADNGYIWYSQVDGQEYYFYEDEVDGEIV